MSITVSNLSFGYTEDRMVLKDVSFVAEDNQLLSILGPNGVGKSTLFRCILGLLSGYSGQITIDGRDIRKLSVRELARHVAYIPQSHFPAFNYSVLDMVLMGTTSQISSIATPGQKQILAAEEALERMGVFHLRDRGYSHLSGGERQLVLMARALVQNARVLVLDEPSANLDFGNQIRLQAQIRSLARDGYTVIQSTHNPDQTFLFSDKVLALKGGQILAFGAPSEIVTDELMRGLYGVDVSVQKLFDDRVRVCVPTSVLE